MIENNNPLIPTYKNTSTDELVAIRCPFRIPSLFILFVAISFLFVGIRGVQAAEIFFRPDVEEIKIGQRFTIDVLLNTEGETINAAEGTVVFSGDVLELRAINDGDSIINLWLERPALVDSCTAICELAFGGVIPGGFEGVLSPFYQGARPGIIFSLVFEAKEAGTGLLYMKDAVVLLHDGLGSVARTTPGTLGFEVIPLLVEETEQFLPFSDDTVPPEEFSPQIISDPNVFKGRWFLIFNTQDKGSGIEYYKVKEGPRQFEQTESPYLLKNQLLYDEIVVQAVDKAGNIREVRLSPLRKKPFYATSLFWIILVVIALVGYRLWQALWRKTTH